MDLKGLVDSENHAIAQREQFDYLSFKAAKKRMIQKKLLKYSNSPNFTYGIIEGSQNNKNAGEFTPSGHRISRINIDQISNNAPTDLTILAFTTNDIAQFRVEKIQLITGVNENHITVVQDYDNHHWFTMSSVALQIADVYIPAHESNLQVISRLSYHPINPVAVGSIQWTRNFLLNHQERIFNFIRHTDISGMHVYYPQFQNRNRVITTFSRAAPKVGFIEHGSYINLSPEERLDIWVCSKLHLICPTTHDVPIRFFDALITGGLPIVPIYITPQLERLCIPKSNYLTYDIEDLLNPEVAIRRWIQEFEFRGSIALRERHYFAMKNFHLDSRLERCFMDARAVVCTALRDK